MTQYRPRPYQPKITTHILEVKRGNVFASMGSGKTPATLEALAILLLFGQIKRALVIGPLRVASATWPDTVVEFSGSFGWMTMAVAVGDAATRSAAIESGAQITTINFENLTWLVEKYGPDWPFDMVVVDESTRLRGLRVSMRTHKASGKRYLQGSGASRAKSLARVAHTKIQRFVNLTGTPTLAGLEALWGPQWFVDGGTRLGNSFSAFTARWFSPAYGSTPEQQVLVPLPYAEPQIRKAIAPVTLVVDVRDYYDIRKPIEVIVPVRLGKSARAKYKEMARDLATEIDGQLIEAVSAGAKSQKLLQIASGAAYTDDKGSWVLVHDEKIEALRSIIENANGMPVLVFYHFKSDLERILKAFKAARVLDKKPATQTAWNDGKIPILVAHPASAGHGLSLQHGGNICCFFSTNWSAENDAQAIERIGPTRQFQSGYDRPVWVYRIVAEDTVEERAVERLKTHVSVQDALLAELKRYCHAAADC